MARCRQTSTSSTEIDAMALQKLRSERTFFTFFNYFFTSFVLSQFSKTSLFFGRFGQLQTRGHASPHALLSIGAGPSARGVQGFGLLDETLSKHRSMISMDLNDSNDFNDLNDSWILGFLLLVSFSRSLSFALSLSLPRFLSFPALYFL